MKTINISNTEDILDVRDIIARVEELEQARDADCDWFKNDGKPVKHWCCSVHRFDGTGDYPATKKHPDKCDFAGLDEDEDNEFNTLTAILADLKGNGGDEQWRGDWYPVTLVQDYYWQDYAQEEAESIYGSELRSPHWPFTCIDWERAAYELKMDYSSIDFDGTDYWYRSA